MLYQVLSGLAVDVNIGGMPVIYLSQADIASKLGTGRTMVNVWRTRFADFPAPDAVTGLGDKDKPGIPGWLPERMDDIRAWLKDHPRLLAETPRSTQKPGGEAAAALQETGPQTARKGEQGR